MAGIYGGYGHENGLTSPTAEDAASLQPPNIAQWVILLLRMTVGSFRLIQNTCNCSIEIT